MNSKPKYVFSRTLKQVDWANTHLVKGETITEINRLKQQPGGDLFIFGSADLAATLIQDELIDEFRLLLNPVVLGRGIPLFQRVDRPFSLHLERTRTFLNGNVLLFYRPD